MKAKNKPIGLLASLLSIALLSRCASGKEVIGEPQILKSNALQSVATKRVLIVISAYPKFGGSEEKTGYWLSEVTHFYHVLAQHGFAIDVTSPQGLPGVMDPRSNDMDDGLNKTFWDNPELRRKLTEPLSPDKIDARKYAVIYYAGGHGTMWDFPDNARLASLAAAIYEQGGIVSAVCHGPTGLLNIKLSDGTLLIKGKKVTGFANSEETLAGKKKLVPYLLEDELKGRGGLYSKAFFPFSGYTVTDGRLVTGQNPNSARLVAEAVIAVLERQAKKEK